MKTDMDIIAEQCEAIDRMEGRHPHPPVRSEPLLAAAFADYWHAKWPHQTRDVKKLEMSAHYVGCRDAFYAGAQAANATAHRTPGAETTKKGQTT